MKSETLIEEKGNHSQYKFFFEHSNDLTCIANTEGYFEVISPNFSKILGYNETELLNKKFLEFIHPEDLNTTLQEIDKLKKGAITLNFINRYRKNDGSYLWLEWSSSPDLTTGKLYAIARDITDRKKSEEIIKQKSEELVKTNNELEQFVYIITHELTEPIKKANEYANDLQNKYGDKIDETGKKYLQLIIEKNSKMESILKSLLFLSRVGKKFMVTTIDCNDLLKQITNDLKEKILSTNTVITSTVLPTIKGNENEIKVLFELLINYAIKFNKKDENPQISISAEDKENEYLFGFKNNGIVIENKYFNSLFIIFNPTNEAEELTESDFSFIISKKIVETHKGKIWAESNDNGGNVIYFTISKNVVE